MRSLLHKDLLILARSRLLLALLVVYPVVIALLIGFAISRSPARPRVAIVDETAPGETIQVGSQRVGVGQYAEQLFNQVQPVRVSTRAQAEAKVADALAAEQLILAAGLGQVHGRDGAVLEAGAVDVPGLEGLGHGLDSCVRFRSYDANVLTAFQLDQLLIQFLRPPTTSILQPGAVRLVE